MQTVNNYCYEVVRYQRNRKQTVSNFFLIPIVVRLSCFSKNFIFKFSNKLAKSRLYLLRKC